MYPGVMGFRQSNNRCALFQLPQYFIISHHYLTSRHNCPKRRLFSKYVDLSDHYVDLYVDLADHYVDLSEIYVDLSDYDVDLSDIRLTSRWQLVALTGYENKIFSYQLWWYISDKST